MSLFVLIANPRILLVNFLRNQIIRGFEILLVIASF